MFQQKNIIIICAFMLCAVSSLAVPDTLYRIVEHPAKGDSVTAVNILRSFHWSVNARFKNGLVKQYASIRPDSLAELTELDTVHMSADLVAGPGVRDQILAMQYFFEGSVLIRLNGQSILQTGVFYHGPNNSRGWLIQNDFVEFMFADSLQHIEITYVPYPHTNLFDLKIQIVPEQLATQYRERRTKNVSEATGMGFYYLAFAVVFMVLFVFFRERTENLYFSLFCLFAALSFLWDTFHSNILYNLDGFLGIFCFEFLSIFFCKVLQNKEKSKVPLTIIALTMALCSLPFIRYNYITLFDGHAPGILIIVYIVLYIYTAVSILYFLIQGVGKKQWEAKTVLIVCFAPLLVFVLLILVFIIASIVSHSDVSVMSIFINLMGYFLKSIVYIYPLAAVYILGRRNGLNQQKLEAQVLSIQQLSEENLAKEKEKKHILEHQKESLEREVAMRTAEIVAQKEEIEKQHDELKGEKKKSDDLLLNILPEEVADELKEKGFSEARHFDNVTVLFADFVDFTKAGEMMTPQELVNELHICFKTFDEIISKYGIEKIKTIGDAYLAVCGLPMAHETHAKNVVTAAGEISEFMRLRKARLGDKSFQVRIGIHSGSVVAGIVGVKKFAYDIWGDTVNTAARMEQNSEAGKINISQSTYDLVKDKFNCIYRGEIDAKNKGMLKMYFVSTAIVG